MRTVAIIQARMSSTRLPGKIVAPIAGKPMLWHVITRAGRARTLNEVVLATSDEAADDAIAHLCAQLGVSFFRGSMDDVLDRYYQAALQFGAEVIVRLTADCPLLDPDVIDRGVEAYRMNEYDYVSNTVERTYPDGLDAEVFSLQALARAWREASWKSEREHVTPYIWKHPELFRLGAFKQERDLSWMRWTVDEPRDLEFVREVYKRIGDRTFGMRQVVELLAAEPELLRLNRGIELNAGYITSLQNDSVVVTPGKDEDNAR